ncbi:unnamed protein product [Orchesella dallaii]|uniref:Uncharacterized protein n=1 Tax=Orchesella dallaii TaxID=48710 RepID=A0ABP1S7F4_9HEXA
MSKLMRDFFRWLCCCCSNRQNGGINTPVIEMQDLRKPDVLPDEQQAGASRFKIWTCWTREAWPQVPNTGKIGQDADLLFYGFMNWGF